MKNIVLIFVFFLFGGMVFAQTIHESNATGNWSAAGTWVGAGVPDLNGNTLNITIKSPHEVTSTTALNFKKQTTITVKNGAKLVIGAALDVDILDVAKNFTFIVETGGILEIIGNFSAAKDATITINGSASITGNLNLSNNPTPSNVTVNGALTITGSITAGTNITGSGTINGQSVPVFLPIELAYFKAYHNKNIVTLNWQTATELNNDYFTLQRSADGVNYETIGTVLGAGTSMTALNYNFTDNKPLNGVSYYRLKQTDYDGAFEVFSPVSVSYLNESEIKIGSNPAAKEISISMGGKMGLGVAKIYNVIGVLVKTIELTNNYTTINVSDVPTGTYILVVSANKTQITKKIMIR